jgi:hypothetical protein
MSETVKTLLLAFVVLAANCAVLYFVIRSAVLSALRENRNPPPAPATYDPGVRAKTPKADPYNWS